MRRQETENPYHCTWKRCGFRSSRFYRNFLFFHNENERYSYILSFLLVFHGIFFHGIFFLNPKIISLFFRQVHNFIFFSLQFTDIMNSLRMRCIARNIHIGILLQFITVLSNIQWISAISSSTNLPTQPINRIEVTTQSTTTGNNLFTSIDALLTTHQSIDASSKSTTLTVVPLSIGSTSQPAIYSNQTTTNIESHDYAEILPTPAAVRSYDTRACTLSEFTCINLRCVPLGKYCDRVNDCGDNSDEPRFCSRKC